MNSGALLSALWLCVNSWRLACWKKGKDRDQSDRLSGFTGRIPSLPAYLDEPIEDIAEEVFRGQ